MHHISLCNINLKKINYNKQKGYKNMVSDMTCLHFSWMTLLLVKEAVSHFFLSPLNFWLWHISVTDASGWSSGWVHLPLLDNLGALIRITMTAKACWCYLVIKSSTLLIAINLTGDTLWRVDLTSSAYNWYFSPTKKKYMLPKYTICLLLLKRIIIWKCEVHYSFLTFLQAQTLFPMQFSIL